MKYKVMRLIDGIWLSSGMETVQSIEAAQRQIQYLLGAGGFQFKIQVLYV